MFQSHNGAIAARMAPELQRAQIGFNPTMVRLLRQSSNWLALTTVVFQSHNGAIAAGFQGDALCGSVAVSIPQWCDCCLWTRIWRHGLTQVSIPQWCDCCYTVWGGKGCRQSSFNPTMVRLLLTTPACPVSSPQVSIPQWCDCCCCRGSYRGRKV